MKLLNSVINQREYSFIESLENELLIQSDQNYLFDLGYLGQIAVQGEKAEEFLQGQLTCDVKKVNASTIQQGALCNLKGRILALMDVAFSKTQGFSLILPYDLIEETKRSLEKTAIFSRVSLKAGSQKLFGLYLQNPKVLRLEIPCPIEKYQAYENDILFIYHLGDGFYILYFKQDTPNDIATLFIKDGQMRGSLAWHVLRLQNKEYQIYPNTRGIFLPHRLDLHLTGYLSFDKGCYKGQEIIARTHYRAKLKHGMKVYVIHSEHSPIAGSRVFDAHNNNEIGELIDCSPINEHKYLVAVSIHFEHSNTVKVEGLEKEFALEN